MVPAICVFLLALQAAEDGVTRLPLLPPGPDNPRNSEGDFIPLKDGRILFIYTRFKGKGGGPDHAPADLASRVSGDGGRTWSEKDEIVVPNEGGQNVMSVSLLRFRGGEIGLFYLRKESDRDCRLYLRRSPDEGRTWGAASLCMPDEGYFVVNNDRVLQLSTGRLVVPAAHHEQLRDPSTALCFLSDDEGKTWRAGKTRLPAPTGSRSGLQEPLVVELKGGRLLMLCRTDQGSHYRSFSGDGGETWPPAEPSDLKSPLSPASLERIPKTGDLLLVWNDHSTLDPKLRGKRTPLTVALSRDEGATWEKTKTLEADPEGWYCYTAIEFVGDRVLLAYCSTEGRMPRLSRTQIASFSLEWLYR